MSDELEEEIAAMLAEQEQAAERLRQKGAMVRTISTISFPEPPEDTYVPGELQKSASLPDDAALPPVPDEQQPVTDQEPEISEPEPPVFAATINMRRKTRMQLLFSLVSLVALGIGFVLPVVWPLLFVPAATILLEPDVQRLVTRAQIRLVPQGTHPLAVSEIPAIMLPQVKVSQQQHVPATGQVHQQATQASGVVTFFNFLTAAQTVMGGTLLTGADGEAVTIDQDVTIPAGTLNANGEATVTAHAVSYGSVGNISAGDIYGPCCRVGIQVRNAPFFGGKDQQDFTIVTKQEYESLVASVTQSVTQKASGLYRPGAGDVLIQPVSCRNTLHADHQPGEATTSLTVTVIRTCTPESYHPQDLQTAILATMTTDAQTKLDKYYRCVMQAVAVSTPAMEQSRVTIPIVVLSTWIFDLSARTQTMRHLLAGKTKQQALQLLAQQPGVKKVVSLELRNTSQLPMKPEQIAIVASCVYDGRGDHDTPCLLKNSERTLYTHTDTLRLFSYTESIVLSSVFPV